MTSNTKNDEGTPSEAYSAETDGKRSLVRHSLHTLSGIIAEAARVYRQARDKKLDANEARSLVWMLGQMRGMVETQALERLEQRLEELAPAIEGKSHGYTGSNRAPRATH